MSVWHGVAMDCLQFHSGLPCPILLRPAGISTSLDTPRRTPVLAQVLPLLRLPPPRAARGLRPPDLLQHRLRYAVQSVGAGAAAPEGLLPRLRRRRLRLQVVAMIRQTMLRNNITN
jgi:hypothetical protein